MTLLGFCIMLVGSSASCQDKSKDIWVPMEERIRIWNSVAGAGNYSVSSNQLEATFEKGGAKWTIMGANAPIVEPTTYPNYWPVKGNGAEVLIVPEPITDYKILPFTDPVQNAVRSDTVSVVAAMNSYGTASFVIRSGDADLADVTIEVSDLKTGPLTPGDRAKVAAFPRSNIDVRTVKCWYQAGLQHNDVKHKNLRPELLLHDDDLVQVDYQNQVNIVRDFEKLQDAESFKPFNLQKKQNKQIWLTLHVDNEIVPGKYRGEIKMSGNGALLKSLTLDLEVLPIRLPEPMLDYVVYYVGYLSGSNKPVVSNDLKTEDQMQYELRDMQEHGLTNAMLFHKHTRSTEIVEISKSWNTLQKTLETRKNVGWGTKPLLYFCWAPRGYKLGPLDTKEKIGRVVSIARSFGIEDVYIYGLDEARGPVLDNQRPIFQLVHDVGAKNFVSTNGDFYKHVPDLLDLPILHGKGDRSFMTQYKKSGKPIWVYSNTGAKVEEPGTYRLSYGINLLKDGFTGAAVFAYQAFYWNDFQDDKYRAHTLAYATIAKPIPTIQWEGWRQGIIDIKFLTLLRDRNQLRDAWLKEHCSKDADGCRRQAIAVLLRGP